MFKIFIFITLLAFSIVFAHPKGVKTVDVADWEAKCTPIHGVTNLEMTQLFRTLKMDELDGVEERFMCYAECFFENFEHKDEHGKMDFMAIFKEYVPNSQLVMPIFEDCIAKYDSEQGKCARSFKIYACFSITDRLENRKFKEVLD